MVNEIFKALMAGTVLFSVLVHDRAQANMLYKKCMAKGGHAATNEKASKDCMEHAQRQVGQRRLLG